MSAAPLRRLGQRPRPFPRDELLAPAPASARRLLGAVLVRAEGEGAPTAVRIVETEAYREDDPASHTFRGRTPRNAVMFGRPGHAYVYFTYGMHWCVNVACEPEGVGAAVLVRAGVILEGPGLAGAAQVRARRGPRHRDRELLAGPARLTQALAVDRTLDGADLCVPDADAPLRLLDDGWRAPAEGIVTGPRVGVRTAADVPWRFHLADVPEVSRYTRHPKALPPQPDTDR